MIAQNQKSAEVRAYRVRVAAELGDLTPEEARNEVADLLELGVPRQLQTMRVLKLLTAVPKIAAETADRHYLQPAKVNYNARISNLSEDQVATLVLHLRFPNREYRERELARRKQEAAQETLRLLREEALSQVERGVTSWMRLSDHVGGNYAHVQRWLGVIPDSTRKGKVYYRQTLNEPTALKIAAALGLDPVEVGL